LYSTIRVSSRGAEVVVNQGQVA